ncbi:hypothetical protein QBC39DRAFT_69917 [Podospora conica]|nr:hypothetical protein QBC39DRAFT_69917 [Schizothecium conicum]
MNQTWKCQTHRVFPTSSFVSSPLRPWTRCCHWRPRHLPSGGVMRQSSIFPHHKGPSQHVLSRSSFVGGCPSPSSVLPHHGLALALLGAPSPAPHCTLHGILALVVLISWTWNEAMGLALALALATGARWLHAPPRRHLPRHDLYMSTEEANCCGRRHKVDGQKGCQWSAAEQQQQHRDLCVNIGSQSPRCLGPVPAWPSFTTSPLLGSPRPSAIHLVCQGCIGWEWPAYHASQRLRAPPASISAPSSFHICCENNYLAPCLRGSRR